ncbi:nucleotide-diphospho-sugar transferase [Aspergillus aurantiobrunneus]
MISDTKVSKAGHFIAHSIRRRSLLFSILAIITLILISPFSSTFLLPTAPIPSEPLTPESSPQSQSSPSLSPHDLLARPISADRTSIPKLIHQTWFPAGSNMSESAQAWVATVKAHHPEWEYVLWDDETDELLVKTHFPWFLETYKQLPKEINRADMARNFYMYLFGGMYADVDTEALRPVDSLFVSHEVSLKPHLGSSPETGTKPVQRAFMGRMAHTLNAEGLGAIPNGWMASPPGHPFWLLPVLYVLENPKGDGSVEGMTGPGILGPLIKQYYSNGRNGLRRQLCRRIQAVQPGWELFCGPSSSVEDEGGLPGEDLEHALVLLPREQVYPFSWVDDGDVKACLGSKGNEQFDPWACKRRMDVDAWPSYFITYCTHTW